MNSVVITGLGVVSPIGVSVSAFEANLRAGICGKKPITGFDTSAFPVKEAFEVRDFNGRALGTHLMDPFIQYAVSAADQAICDAGLDVPAIDPYRIGISVSSSKGGVHTIDRFKERFEKNPSAILGARIYSNSVPNFAAQWIARHWKLKGPAKNYVAACATGTVAVIEGARMVSDGVVDYCVAGASDASITPLMLAGYQAMKALAKENILPFDRRRSGFMVGEGAGILVLEKEENARARGAKIYGKISGYAYGTDASDPLRFDLNEHALSRAIHRFLDTTKTTAKDWQYLNLHGTGTLAGDQYETEEIKTAFGKKAYQIPMSSIKSMTGHMLGASGTVEIIASLLAMKSGFIPPTANLEQPDPACDLDYVPRMARSQKITSTLSLSMGFGGHIAVIGLTQ